MSVNQLLAKALSTDSESEAISCLKMARKRSEGKNPGVNVDNGPAGGKSASEWEKLARKYHAIAIERDKRMNQYCDAAKYYHSRCTELKSELSRLKKKPNRFYESHTFSVFAGFMLTLILFGSILIS